MAYNRYHKDRIGNHKLKPETLMLGYGYDPTLSEGAVKPPVFLTSTFRLQQRRARQGILRLRLRTPRAPEGRGRGSRLFALQPPQRGNRRGSSGDLRGDRGRPPVFVGHVGHRHGGAGLRAARRRDPAFAAALRRHGNAHLQDAGQSRHPLRRLRGRRRRGQHPRGGERGSGEGPGVRGADRNRPPTR